MKESMLTMASKKSAANGSERASAWIGKTPSSTPASRMRWMFSEALNHRSVAQTCTPNSRRRKIDDIARPQPRSSTRIPGRKSSAAASHSVNHSALAPPLTLAMTHSGWYFDERGNRSETNRLSEVMWIPFVQRPRSAFFTPVGHLIWVGDVFHSFELSKGIYPKWVTANGQIVFPTE